jgi:hypothetical protein
MKYDPHFDLDAALRTLETISGNYPGGSPEEASLRAAASALLYVREAGELDKYREFFRQITTPAIESVKVTHTFATSEEAEAWLAKATVPDGELVKIGELGYQVVNTPKGARLLRTRLPEELEPR